MKPKHSPLQDLIGRASGQLGLSLGRDQIDSLVTFERLLRDRAVPLGMIARSDRDRMMRRHVIDCLRAAALVRPEDREALDLGSGAGLPGLVMAIACPHLHVGLVEARRRRAAFLELAAHELGLPNVAILVRRAESLEAGADLATARALAPLDRAWALAYGDPRRISARQFAIVVRQLDELKSAVRDHRLLLDSFRGHA